MRDHFMSLDREAEMDLVNGMLAVYNHHYFDPETKRPFDCGVYVLKYMEIVNPNDLAKRNFKVPVWSKKQLEEFREQIVKRILCDVDDEFCEMVMQVANPHTRHPRPS
ncbi:hypothetical protein PIB30_042036 [Stylosanthes scabra]|uniref:Ubiquitin-like protease family profile domain-containing protein n=1 Tax=Stylosanthes scabra TaxID=79078 RepID=A0ABU6VEP9_9FABA|nr:hypothetical protein [Stylosanthes scabra]